MWIAVSHAHKRVFVLLTGHFWDHHVRTFVPAQSGHPGSSFQEQWSTEEDDDGHRAPSPLLQHFCHPPSQQTVGTALFLLRLIGLCVCVWGWWKSSCGGDSPPCLKGFLMMLSVWETVQCTQSTYINKCSLQSLNCTVCHPVCVVLPLKRGVSSEMGWFKVLNRAFGLSMSLVSCRLRRHVKTR